MFTRPYGLVKKNPAQLIKIPSDTTHQTSNKIYILNSCLVNSLCIYILQNQLLDYSCNFNFPQDHLVCFLPGTLMLAVHNGLDKKYEQFAKDLLETCVQMYKRMPTGLSAELVYFNQGPSTQVQEDITVRVSILTMYC